MLLRLLCLTIQEGIIMDDLAVYLGFKSEKKPEKRK